MRKIECYWLALLLLPASVAAACPPAGYDKTGLEALKSQEFVVADAATRERLALGLLACLGDPDPVLRDGVAFEALATWMRKQQLSEPTLGQLRDQLLPMLSERDPQGFRAPFAALVLSELVRTDRIRPWLDDVQRARLVEAASRYLRQVSDYRGFVDGEGWRHGIAHGADFAMQLALNPSIEPAQLDVLREAIATQIAPAGPHAYIHGESMRLARPVYFIARRDARTPADWQRWLQSVAAPAPLPDWNAAFASEAGLSRRHNVVAFLSALYVIVQEQDDVAARDRLLPGLRAVLKEMP